MQPSSSGLLVIWAYSEKCQLGGRNSFQPGLTGPNDLSAGGDETELGNVDLEDGTLGEDTKGGVQRGLGVLLDAEDGELERGLELGCGTSTCVKTNTVHLHLVNNSR